MRARPGEMAAERAGFAGSISILKQIFSRNLINREKPTTANNSGSLTRLKLITVVAYTGKFGKNQRPFLFYAFGQQ
jgi:hypothetical protein